LSEDRKTRIREYKETPRSAGVFRIRNTVSGKSLVGSSRDIPGMLNRQRFQLELGSHPDRELQDDWRKLGSGAFEFEELDRLEAAEEPGADQAVELKVLLSLWIERLEAAGEELYHRSRIRESD